MRSELEEIGKTLRRQAAHQDRRRRRRGRRVRRRGLHRRRGGHGDPVARRLAEARARGEGPVGHPAARGRRGPGGGARLDQGAGGHLLATSAAPTSCGSTTCPRRPATASRCRSCSSSRDGERVGRGDDGRPTAATPKGTLAAGGQQAAASACASTWIRTASCRPASGRRFAKAAEGDEIVGVQRAWQAKRRPVRGDRRRARAAVQGRRGARAGRPRPRRHRHQGRRRRRRGRLRRRPRRGRRRSSSPRPKAARSCPSARAATR